MRTTSLRRAVTDAVALLFALSVYWVTIFPIARLELARWRQRAATIPDSTLKRIAQHTLVSEGFNAEGAALFATVAPLARRATVVRLLVRFQVMYDYLDALTEQPAEHHLRTSRHLHRALLTSLGEPRPTGSYYAHHAHRDDGGYLDALVAACRAALGSLPSAAVVAPFTLAAAQRSADGQSHSHAAVFTTRHELIRWAMTQAGSDLCWWEAAAASESSLVIHALLASAAHSDLDAVAAARVAAAYWPWITGLNALLDDIVDHAEDAAEGTHSYARCYATTEVMARRVSMLAGRATSELRELPQSRRHAVILAAMTSFYLASPSASSAFAGEAARRVREAIGTDLRVPLTMLAARRRLGRAVARIRAAANLRRR